MLNIRIKRVYEVASADDGVRVLVDRLWPRGLTKEKVQADLWLKEVAPSDALRKWFHHDQPLWQEFKSRYFAELEQNPQLVAQLLDLATKGTLTLLYGARDPDHNQAAALAEYLQMHADKNI